MRIPGISTGWRPCWAHCFPGINKTLGEFNFTRHYGAIVKEVKSGGQRFTRNLDTVVLHEGDTLVLWADDSFYPYMG